MKTSLSFYLYILLFSLTIASSCKKPEENVEEPENEFITTVKLVVINTADSSDVQTATWKQLTPDGSNPPDTSAAFLNLKPGSVYALSASFLDETKTQTENITEEILERATSHGVFYIPDAILSSNITIIRNDVDANNLPLGLNATLTTGANTMNAFMNVILRHQPDGKDGTITPGSTDADTRFRVQIKP